MSLNRVMLMGKALKAPALRWISEDLGVAEFPMSVERAFRMSNGTEKTARIEITIQCYGALAVRCAEVGKDREAVFVEGRLRIQEQKDDAGHPRQRYSIVAERIEFEGAPPLDAAGAAVEAKRTAARARAPQQQAVAAA